MSLTNVQPRIFTLPFPQYHSCLSLVAGPKVLPRGARFLLSELFGGGAGRTILFLPMEASSTLIAWIFSSSAGDRRKIPSKVRSVLLSFL